MFPTNSTSAVTPGFGQKRGREELPLAQLATGPSDAELDRVVTLVGQWAMRDTPGGLETIVLHVKEVGLAGVKAASGESRHFLFHFGNDRHSHSRGMDAALGFRIRYPLHPVHARFIL